MRWFIPSESGDFRLIPHPHIGGASMLCAADLTAKECDTLALFIRHARGEGWLKGGRQPRVGGRVDFTIDASVDLAGAYLAGLVAAGGLTVERLETPGAVYVRTVTATPVVPDDLPPEPGEEASSGEPEAKPTATDRVTVRRPTLCCPVPVPGPLRRASEVLMRFCTRSQWESWTAHGYLDVVGHLSRHRYRIFHREHPEARRLGYITVDLTDLRSLHGYLWSVPPAEEVLAFKLFLENAEPYVRNAASGFGEWFRSMDLDPKVFGSWASGTADASVLQGLARGIPLGLALSVK